jgi:hypothetical protein
VGLSAKGASLRRPLRRRRRHLLRVVMLVALPRSPDCPESLALTRAAPRPRR